MTTGGIERQETETFTESSNRLAKAGNKILDKHASKIFRIAILTIVFSILLGVAGGAPATDGSGGLYHLEYVIMAGIGLLLAIPIATISAVHSERAEEKLKNSEGTAAVYESDSTFSGVREKVSRRHRKVKELYGEYKTTLSSVYTYPLLFDPSSALTSSFEECLVAAQDAEASGSTAAYRAAVEELEDVWDALVLKAVNGKDSMYPETTRHVLAKARKLSAKAESSSSKSEKQELLVKAVELGNSTTVRVPEELMLRLALPAADS